MLFKVNLLNGALSARLPPRLSGTPPEEGNVLRVHFEESNSSLDFCIKPSEEKDLQNVL